MQITYLNSDPIVEFYIKDKKGNWNRFLAYVDSGASLTVLTRDDANRLGITLEKGKRTDLHGISGAVPAYIHNTSIKIAGKILKVKIAFSISNETPRLLGRDKIFESFTVCFSDRKHKITFTALQTSTSV